MATKMAFGFCSTKNRTNRIPLLLAITHYSTTTTTSTAPTPIMTLSSNGSISFIIDFSFYFFFVSYSQIHFDKFAKKKKKKIVVFGRFYESGKIEFKTCEWNEKEFIMNFPRGFPLFFLIFKS